MYGCYDSVQQQRRERLPVSTSDPLREFPKGGSVPMGLTTVAQAR